MSGNENDDDPQPPLPSLLPEEAMPSFRPDEAVMEEPEKSEKPVLTPKPAPRRRPQMGAAGGGRAETPPRVSPGRSDSDRSFRPDKAEHRDSMRSKSDKRRSGPSSGASSIRRTSDESMSKHSSRQKKRSDGDSSYVSHKAPKPPGPRRVLVKDVPEKVDRESFHMYMESTRIGGDEAECDYSKLKRGKVIVTYKTDAVAARVATKKTLKPPNFASPVAVSLYEPPRYVKGKIRLRGPHFSTEVVEGVELYLESHRNGGGEIKNFQRLKEDREAVVEFVDPNVAAHLLKRYGENGPFTVGTTKEKVHITGVLEADKRAVLISSIHGGTKETLEMFLENKRRSGGGDCTVEMIKGGKAVATFESEEVAKRVLSRSKAENFELSGTKLTAEPYYPIDSDEEEDGAESERETGVPGHGSGAGSQSPGSGEGVGTGAEGGARPKTRGKAGNTPDPRDSSEAGPEARSAEAEGEQKDPCTVLVTAVPKEVNKETFEMFMESGRCGGADAEFDYAKLAKGRVVVTYESPDVAGRVAGKGTLVLPDQATVSVRLHSPPPLTPNKLRVKGLSSQMSLENLEMYFENRSRTSGGNLKSTPILKKKGKEAVLEFDNSVDAKRVLERYRRNGPFELEGHTIDVAEVREAPADKKTLHIGNIGEGVGQNTLDMYLSNFKRSGGGNIIEMKKTGDRVVVTFQSEDVAATVIQRSKSDTGLNLGGSRLTAQVYIPVSSDSESDGEKGQEDLGERVVKVTGIRNVDKEKLELTLESPQGANGPIDNMDWAEGSNTAVVTFESTAAAAQLLQRKSLVVGKSTIHFEKFVPSITDEEEATDRSGTFDDEDAEPPVTSLEVKGLPENPDPETLVLLFESKKIGGGSCTVEKDEDSGLHIVTYKDPEVAERVLENARRKEESGEGLKFSGCKLSMSSYEAPLKPGRRRRVLKRKTGELIYEKDLLLVKGCQDQEKVKLIVESRGKATVQATVVGEDDNILIVCESGTDIDYESVKEYCAKKVIEVERVPVSDCVFLDGLPDQVDEETVELFFGSERNGGFKLAGIQVQADRPGTAYAWLKKHSDMERFLSHPHAYKNKQIRTWCMYDDFGPFDRTTMEAPILIPKKFAYQCKEKGVLKFFAKQQHYQTELNEALRQTNASSRVDSDSCAVTVTCLLTKDKANIRSLCRSWRRDSENLVDTFFGKFTSALEVVDHDVWKDVMPKCQELFSDVNQKHVQFQVDEKNHRFKFIGRKDLVERLCQEVRSAADDVIEEKQLQAQKVTEEVRDLSSYQIRFLKAAKFQEMVQERKKNVTVEFKEDRVALTGPRKEVVETKKKVNDTVHNLVSHKSSSVSSFVMDFLKRSEVQKYLDSSVVASGLTAVVEVTNNVTFYAAQKESAKMANDIFKKEILEVHDRNLDGPKKTAMQDRDWKNLVKELNGDFSRLQFIIPEDNVIIMLGVKDKLDGVVATVKDFFSSHTVYAEDFPLGEGMARYLKMFKSRAVEDDLPDLHSGLKSARLDVGPGKGVITLKGTKEAITKVKGKALELTRSVQKAEDIDNRAGMADFFTAPHGRAVLNTIQDRHQAYIMAFEEGNEPKEAGTSVTAKAQAGQVVGYYDYGNTRRIQVLIGDITKEPTDAIVNGANERMAHAGGVANAISKAAGPELQKECSEHVRREGAVKTGSAYTSQAYNLPCAFVIHTVGPKYKNGRAGEEPDLYNAISSVFDEAKEKGLKSVSLPAVSGGIYGYPVADCTRTIVECVDDELRKPDQTVELVRLIDIGRKLCDGFIDALKSQLKHGVSEGDDGATTIPRGAHASRGPSSSKPSTQERSPAYRKPPPTIPPKPTQRPKPRSSPVQGGGGSQWTKVGQTTLKWNDGPTVDLVSGSILDHEAGAIVISVNSELNLEKGLVAKQLLKKAGPDIQEELMQHGRNKPAGTVLATSSCDLGSSEFVFHAVAESWQRGKAKESLRQIIESSLTQADGKNLQSIAFPSIGTGNLHYPSKETARITFEAIGSYLSGAQTGLENIDIVLFGKGDLKTFEDELKRVAGGGSARGAEGGHASPDEYSEPSLEEVAAEEGEQKESTMSVGDVTIRVLPGDLKTSNAEALVHPSDASGQFGGTVGRDLRRTFQGIEDELQQNIDAMKDDGICLTKTGRKVLHVDTHVGIDTAVSRVLHACEAGGIASVALPAIGTGAQAEKRTPEKTAEKTLKAIDKFAQERQGQGCLKEVQLVIYDRKFFEAYRKALMKEGGKDRRGWMDRTKDRVKGALGYEVKAKGDKKIIFWVYSASEAVFKQVFKDIHDAGSRELKEQVITDDTIERASPPQKEKIRSLGQKYQVNIELHGRSVVIRGRLEELRKAIRELNDMISEWKNLAFRDKQEDKEIRMRLKYIEWQYSDPSAGWTLFSDKVSYDLEKAHIHKRKSVDVRHQGKLTVDLVKQEAHFSSGVCGIQRVDKTDVASIEPPSSWQTMPIGLKYKLVTLNKGDNECKRIEQALKQSSISYKQISRIQNPEMYKTFQVKKQEMNQRNKTTQCHRDMWFGTDSGKEASIAMNGFNRSSCGTQGQGGKGVYFYQNVNTARQNGAILFYCSVLVGVTAPGQQGYIVPPARPGGDALNLVDSCTTGAGNQDIVIFFDDQAYPLYQINP